MMAERVLSILTRTPGRPFVSVLIPTRTRPDSRLEQSVGSCFRLASNTADLEFCIKVDHDDQQALDLSHEIANLFPASSFQIHVMDRGNGYMDIPRYVNELASKAKGDWLWLLGDNAWPTTKDWDAAVENWFPLTATYLGCQDVCLFSPALTMEKDFRIPISPTPFVRRKVFDILGHLTMLPCWDWWLNSVAYMAGILVSVPIAMEHMPAGSRTDLDEEVINRVNGKRFDIAIRRTIIEDATKLVDHLEKYEKGTRWTLSPTQDGFHYWRSPLGFTMLMLVEDGRLWINEQQGKLFVPNGLWLAVGKNGELLK